MIEIEWISDLVITDRESDNRQDAVYKNIYKIPKGITYHVVRRGAQRGQKLTLRKWREMTTVVWNSRTRRIPQNN